MKTDLGGASECKRIILSPGRKLILSYHPFPRPFASQHSQLLHEETYFCEDGLYIYEISEWLFAIQTIFVYNERRTQKWKYNEQERERDFLK